MKKRSAIIAGVAIATLVSTFLGAPTAHAAPYAYGYVDDRAFAACLNSYLGQPAASAISVAALQSIPSLGSTVDCSSAGIVSLEGAQYLTNPLLYNLFLRNNLIQDVSKLSGLTNIQVLSLDHNQLGKNLNTLSGMPHLTNLILSNNAITDVTPLSGRIGLTSLELENNLISDPSPLAGLTNLNLLILDDNRIADVSSLTTYIQKSVSTSASFSCQWQKVTLPSAAVGTYPIPFSLASTVTFDASLNTSSPAKSATINTTAWKIAYNAAGKYMVDWLLTASSDTHFGGTYTIVVTDPPGTMYRIMNPSTGEHFYTSSAMEVQVNVASGAWKYEGIGWVAPLSGTAVYRLAAIPGSGSAGHLFTTSTKERDVALASTNPAGQPYWKCETGVSMPACVGWFSGGTIPVFRAFYPGSGQHNYTTDTNEQIVTTTRQGWTDEGIGWYGVAKGNPGAPMPV